MQQISYLEDYRLFKLDTEHSSYVLSVTDEEGFIGHVYYGARLAADDLRYMLRTADMPGVPSQNGRERVTFMDVFPQEYPGQGLGDFRESAVDVTSAGGTRTTRLTYRSHEIRSDKQKLEGLPATFGGPVQTLVITCEDPALGLVCELSYSVFEGVDAILRSARLVNEGSQTLQLTKAMSASLDMDVADYQLMTMYGSWGREKKIEKNEITHGKHSVYSMRGISSAQFVPFLGIVDRHSGTDSGEVYGVQLVYSGNFLAQVERDQADNLRLTIGIHPVGFQWKLEPGESFQTPEAVFVYSDRGTNGMTHIFHKLYREHLIRSPYKDRKRPVLINNWEGTYFDFDTDKLLAIARAGHEAGIEMFVMDDGWFGKRDDDNSGLGDWVVNERKLPGGVKRLAEEIHRMGMKFGIWFEPEMVCPDSDLYRAHPDWAFHVEGREPSRNRNQLVLDMTRQEVRDHIYEMMAAVLRDGQVDYVKWDMNRPLTDLGSVKLPPDRQGEIFHRYMLGVYEMQERLITDFPELLLENCCSGGGRLDPGMLYYSPQIWGSDDTDAIERLSIQEGTALTYPLSAIGAHVSVCPNHMVGRITPFDTRGNVALAGTFGYELDVTKLSEEERNQIPEQIALYHRFNDLVCTGDYYRIASYRENHLWDAYAVVAADGSEALLTYVQVLGRPNARARRIRVRGLQPDRRYRVEFVEQGVSAEELHRWVQAQALPELSGQTLANAGLPVPNLSGDFRSVLVYFQAV
ncbi:MAG: alpha-galactosidase [Butyrivibrio sp.]|nr:alpha-galactosidase [Butyrivibrio sp.]